MTTSYALNDVDIATVATLTEAIQANSDNAQTSWQADVTWTGGFRSEARIREFVPTPSDEPPALGGSNTAPNPAEQLLAALGNCLAVGVAANATARGIELEKLTISVEGDLDLTTFLGLGEGHAGFGSIQARIDVESNADEQAVADLLRHVEATSPVTHTLTNSVPVEVAGPS